MCSQKREGEGSFEVSFFASLTLHFCKDVKMVHAQVKVGFVLGVSKDCIIDFLTILWKPENIAKSIIFF